MEEKKVVPIGKEMYKVEGGKVYIESEELANAIQNEGLDLFVDEEAGMAAIQAYAACCSSVSDK
jgi:hypothetical protein